MCLKYQNTWKKRQNLLLNDIFTSLDEFVYRVLTIFLFLV